MSSEQSALMRAMEEESGENAFDFLPSSRQLDLLRDERGNLPKDALRQVRQAQRNGPGRPKGAGNKRTEKVAKWFVAHYGHPLAALGEVINTPPDVLYEQMILAQGGEWKNKRVTGKDAMEFWLTCVKEALPYVEGKQPIAVDVSGKADAVIFIPGLNAPANFSAEQLRTATENLGIEAIEAAGIRMPSGELLTSPDGGDDNDAA